MNKLTAVVKTGRKDTIPSSYNLFFSNGLRLATVDISFAGRDDKAEIKRQFDEVVTVLAAAGIIELTEGGEL